MTKLKSLLVLPLLLAALALPGAAHATLQPYWYGDFNDIPAQHTQWSALQQGVDGDCCTFGTGSSPHTSIAKFIVEPGDNFGGFSGERAEVSVAKCTGQHGSPGCTANQLIYSNQGQLEAISWSMLFPSGTPGIQGQLDPAHGDWNIFTQWHHTASNCSPPIEFAIDPTQTPYHLLVIVSHLINYSLCPGPGSFGPPDRYDIGTITYDVWQTFELYVRWDEVAGAIDRRVASIGI